MKDENKEDRLLSLLAARRSDAFWAGQKARIMAARSEIRGIARAWLLAPAAIALITAFALTRAPRHEPAAEPQAVTVAFLENLDMLDDMDVLEAVPEEEL